MRYSTYINGVELRSTDYLPNIYVSADGLMIYNENYPYQIKVIMPMKYQHEYHLLAPKKSMHQALARAWVYNPCPDVYNIVDHIDSNTHNNAAWNLRWVTQKLNMANLVHGVGVWLNKWGKYTARVMDGNEVWDRKTFTNKGDAEDFASLSRQRKFDFYYKKHVLCQQAQTPDYTRANGLFYWRDTLGGITARTSNYVS